MSFYALLLAVMLMAGVAVVRAGRSRLVPLGLLGLGCLTFASMPDSAGLVLAAAFAMAALMLSRARRTEETFTQRARR